MTRDLPARPRRGFRFVHVSPIERLGGGARDKYVQVNKQTGLVVYKTEGERGCKVQIYLKNLRKNLMYVCIYLGSN